VVNDTLEEQVKKEADEETRLDFLRTFGLEEKEIIWPGLPLVSEMMDEPADEHPILIAVFLRVNGSYAISQRLKAASEVSRNGIGSLHLSDIIYVKLDQFMQRHLPIAKLLDSRGGDEEGINLEEFPVSGGPTRFIEDKDYIQTTKHRAPLEPTPLQRLEYLGLRQGVFTRDSMNETLAELAHEIRTKDTDEDLMRKYCVRNARTNNDDDDGGQSDEDDRDDKETHVFDSYYPIRLTTPEQCRACSWYLACLLVINACAGAVFATKLQEVAPEGDDQQYGDADEFNEKDEKESSSDDEDEEDEEDDEQRPETFELGPMTRYISGICHPSSSDQSSTTGDPPGHNTEFVHNLVARHAIHRIMGAFVPLFYHVLSKPIIGGSSADPTEHIRDEAWRPSLESVPTPFIKYFPFDTACFHWGDLPALYSVMEHVGLRGVQTVKTQLPIIQVLMKSLPVCCMARDMVKGFLKQCRVKATGEAYWRAVRGMFYCSLAGLYPGAARRADFRSMIRLYHMLFVDRFEKECCVLCVFLIARSFFQKGGVFPRTGTRERGQ
jgi:hypothetical protein